MYRTFIHLLASFAFVVSLPARSLARRQDGLQDLDTYITQIKTVAYVVNTITADTSTTACEDVSLVQDLDGEGYNGTYAQTLM